MLKHNPARPRTGKLEVSVPRLNNATEWHHTGYLVENRDPCFFEAQITMEIQKIFTFSETDLLIKYCCTTRWYFYFVSRIPGLFNWLL